MKCKMLVVCALLCIVQVAHGMFIASARICAAATVVRAGLTRCPLVSADMASEREGCVADVRAWLRGDAPLNDTYVVDTGALQFSYEQPAGIVESEGSERKAAPFCKRRLVE